MSLLDFLRGNYQAHVADWTPLTPRKSSWFGENSKNNAAGMTVNQETALSSSAAFACTRAIAETLASLPAVVFEHQDGEQRQKARRNPLWSLLHDQPNPQMDSMTWYGISAKRVVNRGNAIAVKEFNGRGLPIALWPVHPSRWEAFRTGSRPAENDRYYPGEIFYRIWPDDSDRHYDVPADEVLNVVGFDTEDGIVARGVIDRARQELALDLAEQEYAGSMFANGAVPLGVISMPWNDDWTDEQRDSFRADINAIHRGRENWNKVGILWDKDATWQSLNFNPEQVQALASRAFTAKSICRFYNVPPAIVQIFDEYKFSTVEAMLKHFITLTIRSYAVRFERAINVQLLGEVSDADLFLEFALEGLLRGDPKSQAETNAILRQWGILNADEWRKRDLNMNPIAGGVGQAYLAPLNYATLEQVVSGKHPGQSSGGARDKQEDKDAEGPKWEKSYVAALLAAVKAGARPEPRARQLSQEKRRRRRAAEQEHRGTSGASSAAQPAAPEPNWQIIDQQMVRMRANDTNAIRRLAKAGPEGFLDRATAHYAKFRSPLTKSLLIAGSTELAAQIAAAHCRASMDLLAGLQDSAALETALATWPLRSIRAEFERFFHQSPSSNAESQP